MLSIEEEAISSGSAERGGYLCIDKGLCNYEEVYALQKQLVNNRKKVDSRFDRLVLVEHPDVYTYGRKSQDLTPGTTGVFIERGGEATFHNPGQLVAYPILKLEEKERDLNLFLRRLETVLIHLLSDFGIAGEARKGKTGVWVAGKEKKIASIGVAVSSWVTYHGCALNVNNDLLGFSKISPCGFSPEVMTSMKRELRKKCPSLQRVKDSFLHHFSLQYKRYLVI